MDSNQKYGLSIKEAATYFGIGVNKIREMIKDPCCEFVYYIGKKAIIKREKIENYLNNVTYL